MNNPPKEIIIVGGGPSIAPHKEKLQSLLPTKASLLCNYSFKHFSGTALVFSDKTFYKTKDVKKKPDIYNELAALPLIIGINKNETRSIIHPNTYLFNQTNNFKCPTTPEKGFYTWRWLTGIFAMSLACFLLDYKGKIFLLGMDGNKKGESHYYPKEEIDHKGQHKFNIYEGKEQKIFEPFHKLTNIAIYNVSLQSEINAFKKISYEDFFKMLDKVNYEQDELRGWVKQKLLGTK